MDDIETCEAAGVEFRQLDSGWGWRTVDTKDTELVKVFAWHDVRGASKEDAAKHCREYCGFDN